MMEEIRCPNKDCGRRIVDVSGWTVLRFRCPRCKTDTELVREPVAV